mgnify:CR=1 FL=1
MSRSPPEGGRRGVAGTGRGGEIDLNADLGEGFDDEEILPYLSSCNVACGAHAGNAKTMTRTLEAAHRLGVACGRIPGIRTALRSAGGSCP